MLSIRLRSLFALALVGVSALPTFAQVGRPFTARDLWGLKRIGGLTASTRGDRLACVVTSTSVSDNKSNGDIYLIDTKTGDPQVFTTGKSTESAPAFSPDGRRLAFVARREDNDKPQLYVISLSGGEAMQITELPLGVGSPRWFPDGRRIAFVSDTWPQCRGNLDSLKAEVKRRKERKITMQTSENRLVRYWDHSLMDGSLAHLFMVDVDSRVVTDLTPDLDRYGSTDGSLDFSISPDGNEIALTLLSHGAPYQDLSTDIVLLRPDGSGAMTTITADNPGSDFGARYSSDGKYLLYGRELRLDRNAERTKLMRRDRMNGTLVELCRDFDRSPSNWQVSPDGTTVWFTAEDSARTSLFTVPIDGGLPRRILHCGTNSGLVLAGSIPYFLHQTLSRPSEIATLGESERAPRMVTRFNDDKMREHGLARVDEFFFTGADGERVQSFLLTPPGFDPRRRWPLLVVLHGGPHGSTGDDFHPRWNAQVFASHGWVVIAPNFHGSTGFGEQFAEGINGAHGDKPYRDVMAAVDAVLAKGFIDSTRMACSGGSYGGYLTSWVGTQTSRFACLVVHAGVYNLLGQYASDVTHNRDISYGGTPWGNRDAVVRWSPAHHAERFVTPTLVMHGERDYRVPVTQGLELYGMLKAKGVPARLALFPDENHWIAAPQNSIAWYEEFGSWVTRWIGFGGDNDDRPGGEGRGSRVRDGETRKK